MQKDLVLQLQQGIKQLSLSLTETVEKKLLDYLALLQKWNAAYNLTAVREPHEMVTRHLLDSLSVLPYVPQNARVLDVGTGAGLPGLIIAIARPDCQVTLLDSNSKKIRFLRQAIAELNISNADTTHVRVEAYTGQFEVITSRAFATLLDMVKGSEHLLAKEGEFLAMKGQRPDSEITALPANILVKDIATLDVPFLDEERHLVRLAAS